MPNRSDPSTTRPLQGTPRLSDIIKRAMIEVDLLALQSFPRMPCLSSSCKD